MRRPRARMHLVVAACLLLFAPALAPADDALPPAIAWRQNAFSIPFKVAPATGADQQPSEIRLYVSTNQGAKWDLAQTVQPTATSFTYRAQADGEYWFLIRSVDRKGQLQPELGTTPELRVTVDTVAPRLDLSTTRGEAGEIRATWRAVDPQLSADSLKIEYQSNDGKWRPVAIDRPPGGADRSTTTGTMTWWPADAPTTVKVRAQISDRAGNLTVSNANAEAPSQTARNDAGSKPTEPAASAPSQNWTSAPPPTSKPSSQWPADHVATDPFGRAPINSATLPDGPVESTVNPPIRNQAPPTTDTSPSRKPLGDDVAAPSRNSSNSTPPAGQRPRMVNARSFDLEYEVDGIGPYGIARVELWGTRDGGRTWSSYGADNDNRSPIRATVDGEGLYGFRITVQSGNGLQSQAPRAGDTPQIWVQVDLTKPVVRLTSVEAGTIEHAGELVIHWEASDAALATRPITLAFSDRAGGPWSIIAAGLENTGTYSWRPDNRAPDRIYLRIEARDEAGNIATFDSTEPTALERIRPEAHIREVRPAGDAAFRAWMDSGVTGR